MENQDFESPFCVGGMLAELELARQGQNFICNRKDRDRRRWLRQFNDLLQSAETRLDYM